MDFMVKLSWCKAGRLIGTSGIYSPAPPCSSDQPITGSLLATR